MAVTRKAPLASTFGDDVTAPAWRAKPTYYLPTRRGLRPDRAGRTRDRRLTGARLLHLHATPGTLLGVTCVSPSGVRGPGGGRSMNVRRSGKRGREPGG